MMKTKNNIHVLSRAVIMDQGFILLAYDSRSTPCHYYELAKSFYYLPGGHIEFKESAEKAVIREIKEETGCEAIVENFLGTIEHAWNFPGDEVYCHMHEINLIFNVSIASLKAPLLPLQKEEHVAFKWFPISSLQEIDLRPTLLKELIVQWLKSPPNNSFASMII